MHPGALKGFAAMCWTFEVTLAAASLETLCLLALCSRGRRYDRPNASLILPLVLQEWLQVVLWAHIGSSSTECDATNRTVSAIIAYLVCAVPAWMCSQPLLCPDVQSDVAPELRQFSRSLLGFACLCGAGGALVQIVGQGFGWMTSVCTYPGPWHHQIWPVLNIQYNFLPGLWGSLLGRALSAGNLLLYFIASIGGFMSHRPSYVLPCLAFVGLNAAILILILGREWGSFWCFQASLLGLVALLEPWLFERFGEHFMFVDKEPKEPRKEAKEAKEAEAIGAAEEVDSLVA